MKTLLLCSTIIAPQVPDSLQAQAELLPWDSRGLPPAFRLGSSLLTTPRLSSPEPASHPRSIKAADQGLSLTKVAQGHSGKRRQRGRSGRLFQRWPRITHLSLACQL